MENIRKIDPTLIREGSLNLFKWKDVLIKKQTSYGFII